MSKGTFPDFTAYIFQLAYIRDNGYGGAMVWNIDLDDFKRTCPLSNRTYPLMNLMKEVLDDNTPVTEPPTTGEPGTQGPATEPTTEEPPTSEPTTNKPQTTESPTNGPTNEPGTGKIVCGLYRLIYILRGQYIYDKFITMFY